MVNKQPASSGRAWRSARASLRLNPNLRDAIEFIAAADRRTLSQWLEFAVLDRVRAELKNEFDDHGSLIRPGPFEFRAGRDPRKR